MRDDDFSFSFTFSLVSSALKQLFSTKLYLFLNWWTFRLMTANQLHSLSSVLTLWPLTSDLWPLASDLWLPAATLCTRCTGRTRCGCCEAPNWAERTLTPASTAAWTGRQVIAGHSSTPDLGHMDTSQSADSLSHNILCTDWMTGLGVVCSTVGLAVGLKNRTLYSGSGVDLSTGCSTTGTTCFSLCC